jgi:hypothetical protein
VLAFFSLWHSLTHKPQIERAHNMSSNLTPDLSKPSAVQRETEALLRGLVKSVIREVEAIHYRSGGACLVPEVRSIYIAKTNYGDDKGLVKVTVSMTDTEFTWEG